MPEIMEETENPTGAEVLLDQPDELEARLAAKEASLQQAIRRTVELELAMEPVFVEAHPRVDAIRDNLCIQRGPMVYCLEETDQPDLDLLDVRVAPDSPMEAQWCQDLLGGVVVIKVQGMVAEPGEWGDSLYLPPVERETPHRAATLTAVPYYAWANRDIGTMRVWIPRC